MDGFLLIDKAGAMTSHDVVAKVRKKLDTKKVGHAGTLDPMATGVLVLGVGIATRLLPYITDGKKAYLATILLGVSTHTDDKEGDITFTADKSALANISDKEITNELGKFVGKTKQRPSSVSAIKIDGKTAHARVRAGENVEIAERDIVIDEIKIINIQRPNDQIQVEISVTCSAGTYIRAIARDLGDRLKVGGHLIKLRRNLVSPFTLDQCKSIEESALIPIGEVIEKIFPIRKLDLSQSREISFGRVIEQNPQPGVFAAIDNQDNFVALLENKLQASQMVAAPILVKGSGQ
ncbi:tRNA pseudouridine55 synthase [Candidatus Nanopelagicus abundans]|uniref:tRNA pseudouridine synthase B n=1 Tax=Candidatus Nanopelagicus abundans TaxID=1884916 RepID=A0A249L4U0_9ACTN|nr:tRNA pseudouridine(55) synthase TruB [Candidatus Nanopelagicus abundans]ASY24073.1 tRNA pseudouridine55 synthase [Candidatus Nanopelagicus abundans]